MTVSGEELGVELYYLRLAGRIDLPEAAATFAQASRHIHNTSWREVEGFDQQRDVTYEPNDHNVGFDDSDVEILNSNEDAGYTVIVTDGQYLGAVYGPWTGLRNLLQRYLANTAISLVKTGIALQEIADAYAATDEAAAAELERQSESMGEPPSVPEVRRPGDPHETVTEEREITVLPNPVGDDATIEYDVEVLAEEPVDPLND